ncbi:TraR/DksA C4-type zinc finger protein [Rhizobium sp. 9140]|uniref:TraR/DksA C4-type zinc finger protein n=1 Tax=Rhizobium sp. 9140 TaxID=1761900 RepID=UPI000791F363|nr:TraR/DksA C4-type zinc finger protein [Rhizobium sp. 9140]CZT36376.1 transcriptional regulator, TraR/DksA family [Rhizobium sp. 9140]
MFELAAARAEQERDAGVIAASIALSQTGTILCIACDHPIPEKRRLAYPAARRCTDCQTFVEAEKYHR